MSDIQIINDFSELVSSVDAWMQQHHNLDKLWHFSYEDCFFEIYYLASGDEFGSLFDVSFRGSKNGLWTDSILNLKDLCDTLIIGTVHKS